MNFQSNLIFFFVFLCAHQTAFTRYASLNIGLNISAHFSDENNQLTQELIRVCMKETQLSMADLYRFKANEIQETDISESTQCFAHCIYEQMGFIKNGLFVDNDDSQKSDLNSATTGGGDFVVCKAIRGQNKCDTAYKIHQCIQKVKFSGALRDPTLTMITETTNTPNDETDDEDDSGDSQN